MNGAEVLVRTLIDGGVNTCFANPGTSEMHFVAALDRVPGMRCILGLFEGVTTGAADGYYRMTQRPAATLLHLGPGLANGLANLHNAKKARSGIVNIVGEHGTAHLKLDAPLTSDIEGLARSMSHWVRTIGSSQSVSADGREAITQANAQPGRIATLILPADMAWSPATLPESSSSLNETPPTPARIDDTALLSAIEALRADPKSTLLLLGGHALHHKATEWAGRISQATGCGLRSEFYVERIERGASRVSVPRLPYSVDAAIETLSHYKHIILIGAVPPVAFFAYPNKPGFLAQQSCQFIELCDHHHDIESALASLCEALGALHASIPSQEKTPVSLALEDGDLNPASIGRLLSALIPENGIVIDEAISTGRMFDEATRGAAPHDWLTNMGGSIGFGLPVAVGVAIASPGRKVIALEGDGSAMYTPQALWTLAREELDVTVVIFANQSYKILHGEYNQVGAGEPGQRAKSMLTLDNPVLDWVALATGMGVPASRIRTLGEFADAMRRSLSSGGPSLIEVLI